MNNTILNIKQRVAAERGEAGMSWRGHDVVSEADARAWWNAATAQQRIDLLKLQGRYMNHAMVRSTYGGLSKAERMDLRERLADEPKTEDPTREPLFQNDEDDARDAAGDDHFHEAYEAKELN